MYIMGAIGVAVFHAYGGFVINRTFVEHLGPAKYISSYIKLVSHSEDNSDYQNLKIVLNFEDQPIIG